MYTLYQVDAFTNQRFSGNPAAVVPLESWLPDATMQAVAAENNLAETAFFVCEPEGYRIRWFTPALEVDLCGHATLASAFIYFNYVAPDESEVAFNSRSGILTVNRKENDLLELDFPIDELHPCEMPKVLPDALGAMPLHVMKGRTDYLVRLETAAQVRNLAPDFTLLAQLDARGVCVTAKGESETDFVSRFFAPQCGINEDPVTGSAHCTLVAYWADRLKKETFFAQQVSPRGGDLWCERVGNRVKIAGNAVLYLEGKIWV